MSRLLIVTFASIVIAAPAWAQRLEITPFTSGGFTTSSGLDTSRAPEIDGADVGPGFSWGGGVGVFAGAHVEIEGSYAQQRTHVRLTTAEGSGDLFAMTIGQLQGSVAYHWGTPSATLRPFALAGAGIAIMSSGELPSESQPAWSLGGGLKWRLSDFVGLRVQGRYLHTILGDDASWCGPFGFCSGSLRQTELTTAFQLRF